MRIGRKCPVRCLVVLNREREPGLDRRETGWFYPTDGMIDVKAFVCLMDGHVKGNLR